MTPQEAAIFAAKAAPLFAVPEAAERLLLAGLTAAPGSAVRERARRGLDALNPDFSGDAPAPMTNYCLPDAAEVLHEAATALAPSEQRTRARRALAWLDPQRDVGELALDHANPGDDPLMPFALAVATVQLECLRHADRRERHRLAGLLRAVCREAAAIARRRAGEPIAA